MTDFFSPQILAEIVDGGNELEIRERVQNIDYLKEDPIRSAVAVGKLLLMPSTQVTTEQLTSLTSTSTPFGEWAETVRNSDNPRRAPTLINWSLGDGGLAVDKSLYPIFLYNYNYKDARNILHHFMGNEKTAAPYLPLLCMNLLHQVIGLSHTELSELTEGPFYKLAPLYNDLFSRLDRIQDWLKNAPQPLQFYGGATNTVLRLYDKHFDDTATGFAKLNAAADRLYDLGGGFSTSEISRLFKKEFTSADIHSSSLLSQDKELVIMRSLGPNMVNTVIDDEAHATFVEAQERVPYTHFNVFTDSFPADAQSYAIVSTGFMTSTVRTRGKMPTIDDTPRLRPIALSMYGIYRVMELVAAGKDVDLFTIQRATNRVYKHKTCFLRWKNGALTDLITTNDSARTWYLKNMALQSDYYTSPILSPFLQCI